MIKKLIKKKKKQTYRPIHITYISYYIFFDRQ